MFSWKIFSSRKVRSHQSRRSCRPGFSRKLLHRNRGDQHTFRPVCNLRLGSSKHESWSSPSSLKFLLGCSLSAAAYSSFSISSCPCIFNCYQFSRQVLGSRVRVWALVITLHLKKNYFIFGCVGVFVAARRLSLVVENGGYSSLRCTGFSLRWLLLLRSMGSRHTGFSSCGTRAQ